MNVNRSEHGGHECEDTPRRFLPAFVPSTRAILKDVWFYVIVNVGLFWADPTLSAVRHILWA